MPILHGTWIPEGSDRASADPFTQGGHFYLWVETEQERRFRQASRSGIGRHNRHLAKAELADFLAEDLKLVDARYYDPQSDIHPKVFVLPTADERPLPSLALARYLEMDVPGDLSQTMSWQPWQIDCYRIGRYPPSARLSGRSPGLSAVFAQLKELHFIAQFQLSEVQLGADLLFWYHYTQAFKSVIFKDRYIPALRYRQLGKGFQLYPGWEIVDEAYEEMIARYSAHMPLVCASGFGQPEDVCWHATGRASGSLKKSQGSNKRSDRSAQTYPQFYERESLLRQFSECLLQHVVAHTPRTQALDNQLSGSLVQSCLSGVPLVADRGLKTYEEWRGWRDRICRTGSSILPFYFCFQLLAPDTETDTDSWQLLFKVAPKEFPSLRIALADYWPLQPHQQAALKYQLGEKFEQDLLLTLGDAARIYPALWQGLETDEPVGIQLDRQGAFDFLQEAAWVLEEAGYKVIVPAWWTPQGRRRAQLRLKASGQSAQTQGNKGYFSLDTLVDYEYELAIGGEPVSPEEWRYLVEAQTPLVQFRGEWIALDQRKMKELLAFWKQQDQGGNRVGLLEFMQMTARQGDDVILDFSRDRTLVSMMDKLNEKSALVPVDDPPGLQGHLRDYQKRGVAWLHYLESLGLNGCLADDMGLGKTIQVIARLLQEQAEAKAAKVKELPPTLLIAPTSVLGNWYKELERFAPDLSAMIHHGSDRAKTKKTFQRQCQQHDLVITSFSLVRRDAELFNSLPWHRIVLDEAQNIKNPKAAQTKAILQLSGQHRLALTGTPVENRLLDLWSIFNFLNPGYLGKQSQFRSHFELPIQKDNDPTQAAILKKLVEPFILRRVKTDEAIIKDLPAKVEQKLYCNLTKEQAALYEATVREVERQLQQAEGMQRRGLILSTLMRLKQICNHPRQFLQDGSDFSPARSHKLSRLEDMVAEALDDGDSLLVFTQFTEIGEALEDFLRHTHRYNTYYLHGGTPRRKREQMMAEFQAPDTKPSVFILSLKAGGVGITLTKANHVFHFDRWWNPAVEDQATDRAFRIGQKKNVFVHKFVTIGTLEERIDQMIEDKKKLAGSIVGTDESWLTELDNNAFKQLIALNKTAIMD